jgi:hypothetical protein
MQGRRDCKKNLFMKTASKYLCMKTGIPEKESPKILNVMKKVWN